MKLFHVIKADFSRWFLKGRFFIGILGILAFNDMIVAQNIEGLQYSNIVETVFYYMNDPFFCLNFIISSMIMGNSFCDEMESGYYNFWSNRCNPRTYICSKVWNCFFSGWLLLTLGMFLWILSLRLIIPWADPFSDMFDIVAHQGMGTLLSGEHFILYYGLYSAGIGMIAGILSVITFTVSLFIQNRILVNLFSAICFYLDVAFLPDIFSVTSGWSFEQVLFFPYSRLESIPLILLKAVLYTGFFVGVFLLLSYWQLRRKSYA